MVVIALSNPMLKSVPKMSLSIVLGTTTHRMLFASNTAATATALRSPIMMLVVMLLLSRTPRIFARFWTANSGDTLELPKTVSYTHLRAHETRHDLVCRLLLEKKK